MERPSLIFLSIVVVFSVACGLVDDEDTNVSYTEALPQSFTIDADKLCPSGVDCAANQQPAPVDQPLADINIAHDIDIVAETGRTELRDYANAFRAIEITAIDYKVEANDLTFDLPPTTLYVGPKGASDTNDRGVVELATIPTIPDGQNKAGQATVSASSREASSDLFQNLELATLVHAEPVVKKGQMLPPSGSADMTVTIHVKFTANPQDALD